jgi:SAM-dependent methyltransferase
MDDLTKEYLISFYGKNLLIHGDRPEALRWTAHGQAMRYGLMLEIAKDLKGKKILDYGCGKGDFYAFLKEKNIDVDYTGFDINAELIELAKRKYPECKFSVFDIEEEDLKEDFDYIFLCGVFNNRVEGIEDTIRNVLIRLFGHVREGLSFNGLSSHNPEKDTELNYLSPEEMLSFAVKNLSPYVSFRLDRIPHDFTMFVYRNKTTS